MEKCLDVVTAKGYFALCIHEAEGFGRTATYCSVINLIQWLLQAPGWTLGIQMEKVLSIMVPCYRGGGGPWRKGIVVPDVEYSWLRLEMAGGVRLAEC